MSETTKRMRETLSYSDDVSRLRDRAVAAIEAVEAQVAEAVKRHEDLAAWCAETEARVAALEKMGRLGASPNGDDRTRGGMSPRGFDSPTPAAPTPPASSAVPAPRGFRVGDIVRVRDDADCHRSWKGKDGKVVEVVAGGATLVIATLPGDDGSQHDLFWKASNLTLVRAAAAPEAPAEAPTTRPTPAMELDALRGEVAKLKARAEAADIRADGHAEGLRSIRKMLTKSPPDVDRAILWCDDSLSGYTQSVAATEAETNDRALAAEARAEAAEKELAEARAISAATAERVRKETQIATELRHELADANDRLTSQSRSIEEMYAELDAAQGEMRSLRATISVLRADLAALKGQRDAQTRSYDRVAAECDALRLASLTWFNEKGEPELLATAEEVTERRKAAAKELAALKSKPRFRTRKVTKADVEDFIAHDGCFYESLRALGFRRRVEQSK